MKEKMVLWKKSEKNKILSQIKNIQLENIQANKIRDEKGTNVSFFSLCLNDLFTGNTKELQRNIKTYLRNFILPN